MDYHNDKFYSIMVPYGHLSSYHAHYSPVARFIEDVKVFPLQVADDHCKQQDRNPDHQQCVVGRPYHGDLHDNGTRNRLNSHNRINILIH